LKFIIILALALSLFPEVGVPQPARLWQTDSLEFLIKRLDTFGYSYLKATPPTGGPHSWLFGAWALSQLDPDSIQNVPLFPTWQKHIPHWRADLKYFSRLDVYELVDAVIKNLQPPALEDKSHPFANRTPAAQLFAFIQGHRYLRMLSHVTGEGVVYQALLQSARTHPDSCVEVFFTALAHFANPRISAAFRQAVSSPQPADVGIKKVKISSQRVIFYFTAGSPWVFPVDLELILQGGDTLRLKAVWPLPDQPLEIRLDKPLQAAVLDPDRVLIEYRRLDNRWPRWRRFVSWQPLFPLPDWERFPVALVPLLEEDEHYGWQYGVKIQGGLGINLLPVLPSDYAHHVLLRIRRSPTGLPHTSISWNYNTPLSWSKLLFLGLSGVTHPDYEQQQITLIHYLDQITYPLQGLELSYRRLRLRLGQVTYRYEPLWGPRETISYSGIRYTRLTLLKSGNRLFLEERLLRGQSSLTAPKGFYLWRQRVDLTGVFFGWLSGNLVLIGGAESNSVPEGFAFQMNSSERDEAARLPRFLGQPERLSVTRSYAGVYFSTGYWFAGWRLKWFISTLLFGKRYQDLGQTPPSQALGVGLEYQSFFVLGLYFPLWQSQPAPGEEEWALRVQWQFSWNL